MAMVHCDFSCGWDKRGVCLPRCPYARWSHDYFRTSCLFVCLCVCHSLRMCDYVISFRCHGHHSFVRSSGIIRGRLEIDLETEMVGTWRMCVRQAMALASTWVSPGTRKKERYSMLSLYWYGVSRAVSHRRFSTCKELFKFS